MQDNIIIENYYNTLSKLRFAEKYMNYIYELEYVECHYNYDLAITILSSCILSFEKEIEYIGKNYTARPIQKGNDRKKLYEELKKDDNDLHEDIDYITKCLLIIFAVKCGLEESIDDSLKKISENINVPVPKRKKVYNESFAIESHSVLPPNIKKGN